MMNNNTEPGPNVMHGVAPGGLPPPVDLEAILAIEDEYEFCTQWTLLTNAERSAVGALGFDRYRKATPWVGKSIERAIHEESKGETQGRAESLATRYEVKTAADVLTAPPLQWMVRGVLPAEGLACVFGASGSGKSFLALDLCTAIAGGRSWFSRKVEAAPVVYVALEGEAGFSQRIKAWQTHQNANIPASMRFIMQSFDLRNRNDLQAMSDAVISTSGAGGLLVIDTLNRAASGADENTSRDMGEIINASKTLQARFGGLVLMVHHSGKDQSRGLRGHSSLIAALDASIEVVKLDNRREWRIDKAKDGSDDAGETFHLQVVEIGRHEDGEPITSCVVVPDGSAKQIRRAIPPKSGNQGVAWSVMVEKLRQVSTTRPPDAPPTLPEGCPALPLEFAIEAIRQRLPIENKRKTERAQQALNGLQGKGLIRVDRGYVWIP